MKRAIGLSPSPMFEINYDVSKTQNQQKSTFLKIGRSNWKSPYAKTILYLKILRHLVKNFYEQKVLKNKKNKTKKPLGRPNSLAWNEFFDYFLMRLVLILNNIGLNN